MCVLVVGSSVVGYLLFMLVVGCWLLTVGDLMLVVGCSLGFTRCWCVVSC